jgi:CHAT domain-containing protein
MEYLYNYYLNGKLSVLESLKRAKDELKNLTVATMRNYWLQPETIAKMGDYSKNIQAHLEELSIKKDDYKPYHHPRYWAAFIHLG